MSKLYRSFALCAIGVVLTIAPIAWAQSYTTIDFPGAILTVLNGGPNPEGASIGAYIDSSEVTHGFVLKKGVFTSFDPPGSTSTIPSWISPQGVIVGEYSDASGANHGFVLEGGKYRTIDYPKAAGTVLTSSNPSGQLSGYWCVAASCATTTHSFVMSKIGVFTSFDPPGATSSLADTVIPSGVVFGSYMDSDGVGHGYKLDHDTFTTIDFPEAVFTSVGGANAEGDCVGLYVDTSGNAHSFVLSNGNFTSFDPPGTGPGPSGFSQAAGINPAGVIVGFYQDSAGALHGYIRRP